MIVVYLYDAFVFFFFKQKTAYEMRISDWSSDVCSSDLLLQCVQDGLRVAGNLDLAPLGADHAVGTDEEGAALHADELAAVELLGLDHVERLAQAFVRIADQFEIEALLAAEVRSEEHTSELQSLMRISYAVFCLKKKKNTPK